MSRSSLNRALRRLFPAETDQGIASPEMDRYIDQFATVYDKVIRCQSLDQITSGASHFRSIRKTAVQWMIILLDFLIGRSSLSKCSFTFETVRLILCIQRGTITLVMTKWDNEVILRMEYEKNRRQLLLIDLRYIFSHSDLIIDPIRPFEIQDILDLIRRDATVALAITKHRCVLPRSLPVSDEIREALRLRLAPIRPTSLGKRYRISRLRPDRLPAIGESVEYLDPMTRKWCRGTISTRTTPYRYKMEQTPGQWTRDRIRFMTQKKSSDMMNFIQFMYLFPLNNTAQETDIIISTNDRNPKMKT